MQNRAEETQTAGFILQSSDWMLEKKMLLLLLLTKEVLKISNHLKILDNKHFSQVIQFYFEGSYHPLSLMLKNKVM